MDVALLSDDLLSHSTFYDYDTKPSQCDIQLPV